MRIGVCTEPDGLTAQVDGVEYVEPTVGALLCPREADAAFEAVLASAAAAPPPDQDASQA